MSTRRTQLLVVEGPDRVGKATQTKLLFESLTSRGFKVARVEVPFNDNFTHKLIYFMLKNGWAKKLPNLFQTVQIANRIIYQTFVMNWTVSHDYDFIIFDRWHLSSEIYGKASNVDVALLRFLSKFITKVDLTFVLIGVPHTSEARDDYEKDIEFQNKVRELYNEYARRDPGCVTLDSKESVDDIHRSIMSYLELTQRI